MISASTLNSELINKIAQDFAQATSLAVVVVNIHGDEISELFNFTPFCQLMRQHPQHSTRCRMSDRCGGLEASKSDQPCIYRCHAGLTDFSIPWLSPGIWLGSYCVVRCVCVTMRVLIWSIFSTLTTAGRPTRNCSMNFATSRKWTTRE